MITQIDIVVRLVTCGASLLVLVQSPVLALL